MAQDPEQPPAASPVETYENYFVPAIFRPWASELLQRLPPRPGERALDLACGTGAVTLQIAPLVGESGSVTGLDPNQAMLDVARSKSAPVGSAIEWREGEAGAMPFDDGAFDLVYCQHGLQFFPDRAAAISEVRRVLAPGGRVGMTVWRDIKYQTLWYELDLAVERVAGIPPGGGPFSLGDRDELAALFEGAGLRDVSIDVVTRTVRFPFPDQYVRLATLGSAVVMPEFAQMNAEDLADLVRTVREDLDVKLETYLDGDVLAFQLSAHIATARA
jgi:ubiquinone/menaquinone biosynthesis C-methylase UbiE